MDEWEVLRRGTVGSGLRYHIVPNARPPESVEMWLKVGVGSMDEREEEEELGLAHYVEHAVFLGTQLYPTAEAMRTQLAGWGLSFGGDANAYTDFRETVYTLRAPTLSDGQSTLPKMLEVLAELAFFATFPAEAVSTELGAVLSELQLGNTVQYRAEVEEYRQIFWDAKLPHRMPIGTEACLRRATPEALQAFYRRWYRPSRMELLVVGAIDVQEAERHILDVLGPSLDRRLEALPWQSEPVPDRVVDGSGFQRNPRPLAVFQHALLPNVTLTFTQLLPCLPMRLERDRWPDLLAELLSQVLDSRASAYLHRSQDPAFTALEWDRSDSPALQCGLSTLEMEARPTRAHEAVQEATALVASLALHGATAEELAHAIRVHIRAMQRAADKVDSIKSSTVIETLLDCINLGHPFRSPVQEFQLDQRLCELVTLSELNSMAHTFFSPFLLLSSLSSSSSSSSSSTLVAHSPSDLLETDGSTNRSRSPANSIFVTAPPLPTRRKRPVEGFSSEAEDHSDPKRWNAGRTLEADMVAEWMQEGLQSLTPSPPVRVPERLVDDPFHGDAAEVPGSSTVFPRNPPALEPFEAKLTPLPALSPHLYQHTPSGAVFGRLANGMSVTYLRTHHSKRQAALSISWLGGDLWERSRHELGSTHIGLQTLATSGVGPYGGDVVAEFCAVHGLRLDASVHADRVSLTVSFSTSLDGLDPALQLLHALVLSPRFELAAFTRAVQAQRAHVRSVHRDLDHSLGSRFYESLSNPADLVWALPRDEELAALTLEQVRLSILRQLQPLHTAELLVVGDVLEEELHAALARYMATLPPSLYSNDARVLHSAAALQASPLPRTLHYRPEGRAVVARLEDDEVRAFARLAFPVDGRRRGGVARLRSWTLLARMLDNRLFAHVREDLGLVYSASFSVSLPVVLDMGLAEVYVNPFVDRLDETLQGVMRVLAEFREGRFDLRDVEEARKPLVASLPTARSSNSFWMRALRLLNADSARRDALAVDLALLEDMEDSYLAVSLEDLRTLARTELPNPDLSFPPLYLGIGFSGPADSPSPHLFGYKLAPLEGESSDDLASMNLLPPLHALYGQQLSLVHQLQQEEKQNNTSSSSSN